MVTQELILKAIHIKAEEFYLIESEVFVELYSMKNKPDFVIAFLNLSSWMGTSLRSGVWTYYEVADIESIDITKNYISKTKSYEEICKMYVHGIHDYANEKYQEEYDYPQEWLDESERIDEWINDNIKIITKACQTILRDNQAYFSN